MLSLTLGRSARTPLTLLCLGAHADDIEIGCGGTLLSLLDQAPHARVHWVVLSASPPRADEARRSARAYLSSAHARVDIHDVRDGLFPGEFARLKAIFETLKTACDPDLIFTHHRHDSHQDHRAVAELTQQTFRKHLVLEYEIPKYDPDIGNPNLFVPLSQEHADFKVAALMQHFASQHDRAWFEPRTFYGMMRLRGMHAAAPSGMAEAFHGPKLSLSFDPAPRHARGLGEKQHNVHATEGGRA
jgi:LmbE family N-acetylglucosaminyl deacetylase